ncbi:MAG TPA: T9SS type A sorting domain-containing protein [Bacteroidia bacterium]|nr:T9SS type A sorting domain-containing protein [Bacteroidia bacterium]HNU34510.1 T9SS type A sorting domain-containing protein [Bacteroidia bacterium]
MKKIIALVLVLIVCQLTLCLSQQLLRKSFTLTGTNPDGSFPFGNATKVIQTSDGGYAFAFVGLTGWGGEPTPEGTDYSDFQSAFLIKTDANFNQQWGIVWQETGWFMSYSSESATYEIMDLKPDTGGTFSVLLHFRYGVPFSGPEDFYDQILTFNNSGNITRSIFPHLSSGNGIGGPYVKQRCILIDPTDGSKVYTGLEDFSGPSSNVSGEQMTYKFSSNGSLQWITNNGGYEFGASCYIASSGNYLFAGRNQSGQLYVVEMTSSGTVVWAKRYAAYLDVAVITPTSGGYFIGGSISGTGTSDFALQKIDLTGNTLFAKRYASSGNVFDKTESIIEKNGSLFVSGSGKLINVNLATGNLIQGRSATGLGYVCRNDASATSFVFAGGIASRTDLTANVITGCTSTTYTPTVANFTSTPTVVPAPTTNTFVTPLTGTNTTQIPLLGTAESVICSTGCALPSSTISATGPTTFCTGGSVTLNETTGASGVTYQWQQNSSNINGATLASYSAATAGSYTCIVTNTCGSSTSNSISVTVNAAPPQPGTISGITQACNPVNNVPFSIAPVPGATSYNWYSLNPAVTVNAPANGTNVTVNLGAATSSTYSLRVEAINACGTSQYQSTTIRRTVSGVTTVTGTNLICTATNGVAYSCNSVSGADSYFWTVPAGATIASGQGTSTITVDFTNSFNGGSVCVSSQLNCGFSATPKCFSVAKGTAPTPGNVSGSSTVCSGGSGNYSIVAIPGVTYNWSVPSGASITSGAGTNAVTVLFPTSFSTGNVCVNITNVCGVTSITKCRGVVTANPSRPASITGNTSGVCNSLQNYSCAASTNATSYLWSVTGGTIQSGQGTQTVSVLWNATGTTGTLNVNGVNACGNGLVRSVSVNLKPSSAASITGNVSACANTAEVYNFTSLYGATNYLWSVNTASGASVTAGQGTTAATIQWATNGGTVYCTPSNVCGSSSTKTLAVNITCRQAGEGIVSESNLFNVTAIPNPFNNELNISSSVYGDGIVLKLSDMLGRVVLTQPLISENTLVQTSQLKNGIYFVEVMNGTEKKTFKVVKTE